MTHSVSDKHFNIKYFPMNMCLLMLFSDTIYILVIFFLSVSSSVFNKKMLFLYNTVRRRVWKITEGRSELYLQF